jgi:hypothetical protein
MFRRSAVYREVDDGWWNIESNDQDRMATEEQGPLLDRSRENLAASDRGIVLYRTILNDSLAAIAGGGDRSASFATRHSTS